VRNAPILSSTANLPKGSDAKPPVCGIDEIHQIAGLPTVIHCRQFLYQPASASGGKYLIIEVQT
jgi:hypothetical protein